MKQIELRGDKGKNKFALVDDEDYEFLNGYKWHCSMGYARRSHFPNGIRKIMTMQGLLIKCPKGKVIDHINGNKLDNRKANLRVVTNSQNNINKPSNLGNSKYKGVCIKAVYPNKFYASIKKGEKHYMIGYFDNEIHAAMAYDLWAKDLFGEYAYLNFQKIEGA